MFSDQVINPDRLDRPMNKYWMLSVFMYDRDAQTARKNEAYNWNEKAGKRLATYRNIADKDPVAAEEYFKTHQKDIIMGEELEETFRDAGEVRAWINDLSSSPLLIEQYTKEQREQMVKDAKEVEKNIYAYLRTIRTEVRNQ
jgi:hypothetical protein